MTIIIGLINTDFGIVGCDSRIFDSAKIENGKVVKEATPIEGDFDKTFIAKDGKIIGAVAGLMKIDGKNTIELIVELINQNKTKTFHELVDELKDQITEKLEITEKEVIFTERLLNLIIISSETFNNQNFSIYTLDFIPVEKEDKRLIEIKINKGIETELKSKMIYKSIRGDTDAIKASDKYIEDTLSGNKDRYFGFVHDMVKSAIQEGINKAGNHKYGSEKSCGGKVNTKRVRNK